MKVRVDIIALRSPRSGNSQTMNTLTTTTSVMVMLVVRRRLWRWFAREVLCRSRRLAALRRRRAFLRAQINRVLSAIYLFVCLYILYPHTRAGK